VICNRAKPDRRGGASLQPLEISEYPWEFVGIDYGTELPKSGLYGHTYVFLIMVCHLTNMAHFVPCHKKIIAEQSTSLFRSNCYRDSKFVGKLWQSVMGKLNTKLNMSIARHPRTESLAERVNQAMQTLLRC
jgi:hypothetical protein